jgi:multicomponent Na+:H+ antiporter subunit E
VAATMGPLGDVAAPWTALEPRRLRALLRLVASGTVRVVRANVVLSRRIWSPRRPLRSGMVVVATRAHTDGELAAVGLISSLIVDNQLVDLDRSADRLQYHAVAVPEGPPERKSESINAPVERLVAPLTRRN